MYRATLNVLYLLRLPLIVASLCSASAIRCRVSCKTVAIMSKVFKHNTIAGRKKKFCESLKCAGYYAHFLESSSILYRIAVE